MPTASLSSVEVIRSGSHKESPQYPGRFIHAQTLYKSPNLTMYTLIRFAKMWTNGRLARTRESGANNDEKGKNNMKYRLVILKLAVLFSFLCVGENILAVPAIEGHVVHYTLQPTSGPSFNRVEELSIVVFANKLSNEYRSPFTLVYRIVDKEGNVIDDKKEQILFTMCNDKMVSVKAVGECGEYNNVAIISLKTRSTRRPPSTIGYSKIGRFWIKEEEDEDNA